MLHDDLGPAKDFKVDSLQEKAYMMDNHVFYSIVMDIAFFRCYINNSLVAPLVPHYEQH